MVDFINLLKVETLKIKNGFFKKIFIFHVFFVPILSVVFLLLKTDAFQTDMDIFTYLIKQVSSIELVLFFPIFVIISTLYIFEVENLSNTQKYLSTQIDRSKISILISKMITILNAFLLTFVLQVILLTFLSLILNFFNSHFLIDFNISILFDIFKNYIKLINSNIGLMGFTLFLTVSFPGLTKNIVTSFFILIAHFITMNFFKPVWISPFGLSLMQKMNSEMEVELLNIPLSNLGLNLLYFLTFTTLALIVYSRSRKTETYN